jgi:UDP:flavonoid glycosyltransferase YjiC (YdhE family)
MHAILASVGTDGDVNPYVGLGIKLRERGHRVTLVANEHFRQLAVAHGLAFRALITNEEYAKFIGNPDLWHPIKTVRRTAQWGVQFLDRQYALLAELAKGDDAVLVASVGVVGARLVQEKLARPLASVILQPWMIPSINEPPVMPGGLTLPRWAPRVAGKLYWRLVNAAGDLLVGRPLNRLRASLDLRPIRCIFDWWNSPELIIGMFPDWYGPPQADWPRQIRLAGFPQYDGVFSAGDLPAPLLEFCRAGSPPVAFTFGTGMMHAGSLFRAALEACRKLRARGIFLTKFASQLPSRLMPFVRHWEFAPFQLLFPHCAAVVHHGGVGTTARALTTGTPQLVLPLAFDQMDNATRVRRLGMGDWLNNRLRSGAAIAQALARLMTPETTARCRAKAAAFGNQDAFDKAAQWIEVIGKSAARSV